LHIYKEETALALFVRIGIPDYLPGWAGSGLDAGSGGMFPQMPGTNGYEDRINTSLQEERRTYGAGRPAMNNGYLRIYKRRDMH
jgi:hypothetical protein